MVARPGFDPGDGAPGRLDLLKALGDNTRYAIYLELARSPHPIATAAIADALELHPNTVRPHLERMREVGLLEVRPAQADGVGRPQHLYSLAPDAPALGLEQPAYPVLARMLLQLAADAGLDGEAAVDAGRSQGEVFAAGHDRSRPCLDGAVDMLARLGFDPEEVAGGDAVTVAFTHCPFADLAESNPDLVCSLHRGMLEGFVDSVGGAEVVSFFDRSARTPCLVELAPT
jgi:predicted ArsR family transcriptional regulator